MKLDKEIVEIEIANKGLLISELCSNAGITRVCLKIALSGERETRPQTVGKIAKALNVPVERIIKRGK